jgi:hypothetical protein
VVARPHGFIPVTPNAAVQPQIRAQREFVGWKCLLDGCSVLLTAHPDLSAKSHALSPNFVSYHNLENVRTSKVFLRRHAHTMFSN